MKKTLLARLVTSLIVIGVAGLASTSSTLATTWMIGDDDGYGKEIADNANHNFNGFNAGYDGRAVGETEATNGAQYTDTYSTTHHRKWEDQDDNGKPLPDFGPQPGTVATFTFPSLGSTWKAWKAGSMWFDMADFQATEFGAVKVTYNGIEQDWAFNDGFPATKVRFFNLSQAVLDSIKKNQMLTVVIDRNMSTDFYGFDYAMLSDEYGPVPEPATMLLFGIGIAGLAAVGRNKSN